MEKVLLITGASSEVGIQLLKEVYDEYDKIYLQYRTMNKEFDHIIKKYNTNNSIIPLQADFRYEEGIHSMIDKIKEIGVLPNNIVHLPAPKAYNKQFHKDKWDNYNMGWEISVHSIVLILQAFIPNMVKSNYGRIVFMLTNYTQNLPAKYQSAYVTIKYALLGLMKSLSVEYIEKGITVNGVSPDMMETKFLSEIPEMIIEKNREKSPLGRNVLVEEVTPVIRHMLSDLAASMTGQNIGISCGL